MTCLTRCILAIAFAVGISTSSVRADIITYQWNDAFTGSSFYGQFQVDTDRLADIGLPGKYLVSNAILTSEFRFSRASFGIPVSFQVYTTQLKIAIDPATGAILTDGGEIDFYPSNTVLVGTAPYQLIAGHAQLDTNYNVNFGPGVGGGESAFVQDSSRPNEYFASSGFWDVTVTPTAVPAPPAILLGLFGLGCVVVVRLRKGASLWQNS
jgi:hypothetical protein